MAQRLIEERKHRFNDRLNVSQNGNLFRAAESSAVYQMVISQSTASQDCLFVSALSQYLSINLISKVSLHEILQAALSFSSDLCMNAYHLFIYYTVL